MTPTPSHISSHWKAMLETFQGTPETLIGVSRLWSPATNPLHSLFQSRFLQMGRAYTSFPVFLEAGRRVAKRQGRAFDLDMLRQSLTLAACEANGALPREGHFVVIGDGFAALGSTLAEACPAATITFVNIAPVLQIDQIFFRRAHPSRAVQFVVSEDIEASLPEADLSFDIACMGEVDPRICALYFSLLKRRVKMTYSCNRELKRLPDGTETRIADYDWQGSRALLDERCPWHQQFYAFRPPFWRSYDGPIRHKLVQWE